MLFKDIELGLKSPMESFSSINLQSVAGWEYSEKMLLFESKDCIVLVITEPGFPRCTQNDTDLAIWYQIVSVS